MPNLAYLPGLFLFSIGLLVVLRARIRELVIFTALLNLPLLGIGAMLSVQLLTKQYIFDLSDVFLIVIVSLIIAIMVNIFLFIRHLQSKARHRMNKKIDL